MPEPKKAVAIRYEHQRDSAPRVVAKGAGEVAEAILRTASSANVPVYENREVLGALMGLEVDSVIPSDLYQVVAEVLAFVYRAKQQR